MGIMQITAMPRTRLLLAAALLAGASPASVAEAPPAGRGDVPGMHHGMQLGPRTGGNGTAGQEFGLLPADRYFYVDNAGLRRIHAVLNGQPFKLTTDPAEVSRGANTYLMSDTGEVTIDMVRYMIPGPETDTVLNRMSIEGEGPPGADAFIVVADQYITDSITYVLDLDPVPEQAGLLQNYPNPFNGGTTIVYEIPTSVRSGTDVRLEVYDVLGRRVRLLVEDRRWPGSFTVSWDGRNERGEALPSGAYFYRVLAGDYRATKKLMILR